MRIVLSDAASHEVEARLVDRIEADEGCVKLYVDLGDGSEEEDVVGMLGEVGFEGIEAVEHHTTTRLIALSVVGGSGFVNAHVEMRNPPVNLVDLGLELCWIKVQFALRGVLC